MQAKEFFKRFVWGAFFSSVIYGLLGVFTAAYSSGSASGVYYEFITAGVLLVMGGGMAAYYLLGHTENVGFLLSAVGAIAVAVYMFVPTFFSWKVVPIALGILAILRAASEVFEAIGARKRRRAYIVRLVFAAAFAACGVVSCVRPFASVPSNWVFTGVVIIAQAVCELIFLALGGLFREEEQLKFRPVKREKPEAPQGEPQEQPQDGREAQGEAPQEQPQQEKKSANSRRGARRH